LYLQNETLGDGGGGQVVEHLPSKHETLSSNTSTVGRKEGRKEERKKGEREEKREGKRREEKTLEDYIGNP
jgi:3-oxoacyl-[acyl-carrier-protein] synthase III